MFKDIEQIIDYFMVQMVRQHLKRLRKKYSEEPNVMFLVKGFERFYRVLSFEMTVVGAEDQDITAVDKAKDELSHSIEPKIFTEKIKHLVQPLDYILLKLYGEGESVETEKLAEQALIIEPENLELMFFAAYSESQSIEDLCRFYKTLSSNLALNYPLGSIDKLWTFLGLIHEVNENASSITPEKLKALLHKISLPLLLRYSLYVYLLPLVPAKTLSYAIGGTPKEGNYDLHTNPPVIYFYGMLLFNLKYYTQSLRFLGRKEILPLLANTDEILEYYMLLIEAYWKNNRITLAVGLLKFICYNEEYEGSCSEFYFDAVCDLSAYYMKIKKYQDSMDVLDMLKSIYLENLDIYNTVRYFELLGDLQFAENRWFQSLDSYKKILPDETSKRILIKIWMIESIN